MAKSLLERFNEKYIPEPNSGCWLWLGAANDKGYGVLRRGPAAAGQTYAHRISYELHCEPIPNGSVVDHKCKIPICVNPSHLEPVTQAVNVSRGRAGMTTRDRCRAISHCKSGHPLSGENISVSVTKQGYVRRICRSCQKLRQAKYEAKLRA